MAVARKEWPSRWPGQRRTKREKRRTHTPLSTELGALRPAMAFGFRRSGPEGPKKSVWDPRTCFATSRQALREPQIALKTERFGGQEQLMPMGGVNAGKGRALGRRVVCDEDLTGLRVCLVDDLWTTGITLEQCAQALKEAGAEWPPGIVALASTESTRSRAEEERRGLMPKRKLQRDARKGRPELLPK